MKRISLLTLIFIAASLFAACGAPAENKTAANTANTAITNLPSKPANAALDKDSLMANETRAWGAWKDKDGKYFEDYLADNAIDMGDKGRSDKASLVKRITDPTCEVTSFSLNEDQMTALGTDAALLTYKAEQSAKCGGKALPTAVWAATVVVRSGDKWKAVYHGEVSIVDPKNAPKAALAAPAKKEEPKKDDKAAATSNSATKPAAEPNTAALMAIEKSVWEAWKNHDGKKIDELTAKDISFINIFGTFFATKADALKDWTSTGCDVKSVSVTDGAGTMLSPTVGILTFKGAADGTCYGQKVGPIWGTSIYVKDGDTWKWAFGMNLSAG